MSIAFDADSVLHNSPVTPVTLGNKMLHNSSALFGELPVSINFQGLSAQGLLDFYATSSAAATANNNQHSGKDWASDGQQK
jgi:hypothetical protein